VFRDRSISGAAPENFHLFFHHETKMKTEKKEEKQRKEKSDKI
jgi:hypothetical protein